MRVLRPQGRARGERERARRESKGAAREQGRGESKGAAREEQGPPKGLSRRERRAQARAPAARCPPRRAAL
eukprot:6336533-Prymnesium_polylepis.1